MNSIKQTVRENIRRLRLSAGLSQQKLAERTGKSLRYVNYLENRNTNVTIEVLETLAKGIGVPIASLISANGSSEAPPKDTEAGLRYLLAHINESLAALEKVGSEGSKKSEAGGPASKRKKK